MRPSTAYLLAAVTVAAGAAVLSGDRVLGVLGGLPLGLVLPGLALSALLFRRPGRLLTVERIMLVPALSLGTIVAGGLVAWAAGAPLHRPAWLVTSAGVTLAGLAAAAVREHNAPRAEPVRAAVLDQPASPEPASPEAAVSPGRVGGSGSQLVDRRRRLVRLVQLVLPVTLAVLMLAGAAALSLVTSIRSHQVTVTTLSVVPPGPPDASGEREIQISATGLSPGVDGYTLQVTSATLDTRTGVTAGDDGRWSSTLRLPGDERLTLALYRTGEPLPMRTVIVASAATG